MPGAKLTETTYERIHDLHAHGWSCREIAAETGVSPRGVSGVVRRGARTSGGDGLPRNVGPAVERYRSVLIEATLDGRFEVTIDEDVTGPAMGSLQGAIYAAAREYEKEQGPDLFDDEELAGMASEI